MSELIHSPAKSHCFLMPAEHTEPTMRRQKGEQANRPRSPRVESERGPRWNSRSRLVHQLQCELELPAVKSTSDGAKVAGAKVGADTAIIGVTLELSVVPHVERVCTELHVEALGDGAVLEQRHVPIVAARTAQRVVPEVAVAIRACNTGRSRKDRRIEPFRGGFRISNRAGYIWPGTGIADHAGSGCATDSKIQGRARFHGDDAREGPSTQRCFQRLAVAVVEERNIVDEVGEQAVGAIVETGAAVVAPSQVWIRHVIEIAAAAAGGSRIH